METEKIKAYKGFNNDMTCRDFQYEVGKEYEQKGKIEVCENGFHACENPMNVFGYYPPNNSRYCEVEQSGTIGRSLDKIASSKIRIQCEIGLSGIIQAGVKFILDKVNWKDDNATNTGENSAATNTGEESGATDKGQDTKAKLPGSHRDTLQAPCHPDRLLLPCHQHRLPLRCHQHRRPLRCHQHRRPIRCES